MKAALIPVCVQYGLKVCTTRLCPQVAKSTTRKLVTAATAAKAPPAKMLKRLLMTGCNNLQQQRHRRRHPQEEDCSQLTINSPVILRSVTDRFKGVHVSLDQLPPSCSPSNFGSMLNASLDSWSQSKLSSVWLQVPIEKSHFIPEAAKFGFRFHHAENCQSVLCLWLRKDIHSLLPTYATHQVGVAGCIVHGITNQVLVVKDKMQSHPLWKFPGGLSELGEDIDDTAKREVWEETGLRTNFHGILAFRQQHEHPDAYGRSDLFYVCLMTPVTYDLDPCKEEIAQCKWMTIGDLEGTKLTSAITKRCLQLVRRGLKNGFSQVTIRAEECQSIYKNKQMKLFSRNLEMEEDSDLGDYPYHITTGDHFD